MAGAKAFISDWAQLHHLKDVLRLKVKDEVEIADSAGNCYAGVITAIGKKQAEVRVALKEAAREAAVILTIACAIPKGGRFDDTVDFLTQLGVERIIPMRTERVVVKLDDIKAAEKHRRWLKIAQSAAQQSRRNKVPDIGPVTDFKDIVSGAKDYGLKLIPHLTGERKPIREILGESPAKNIIVLIGPEGDFTPEEVALALDNGFLPVSLGDTVLRVAAAAIAVAGYIKLGVGD